MDQVDIAHLTFKPPFAAGSYNRLVGAQIQEMTEFRQVAVSYWDGQAYDGENSAEHLTLVNGQRIASWQKAYLSMPERVRRLWFNGIGGREALIYAWQTLKVLPKIRPRLIVCYDGYKLGPLLRQVIDWPCRIVLSQMGLSYYLPPGNAQLLYSLKSFDAVWLLTHATYRFDRKRMAAYELLVKVLPLGVDVENHKPVNEAEKQNIRSRWGLPQDSLVVLLLSRLVPKKGAHVVLESWPEILREVPNAYLWIVGGGDQDYEGYLQNLIQALGVSDTARLQGAVPAEVTASCYQASDLYVFPTLTVEGQSLALLEGMSSGVACVASDHEGARDIYSSDEVLFVEDPNIEDAFVEPVVRLLRDPHLREKMGASASALVRQRYSYELMFARIREFYRRQLDLVGDRN